MKYLALNVCPNHGTRSLSVDDEYGGTRIGGPKCCGRWNTVEQWLITADVCNEIEIAYLGYLEEEEE